MNTVFIVLKNGKVVAVFSNEAAAIAHKDALLRKWSLSEIIEKEVFDI